MALKRIATAASVFVLAAVASAFADDRLALAAKAGDAETVRSLLRQKVAVNAPESDGTTALQWAAHRGDRAMADLLIKAGADVSLVNRRGVSALTAACESGSDAVVSRLLDAGADPNTTKRSGASAAMLCARSGTVAALQALIAKGANVKVAEPLFGQTALHWAAAAKHSAVVELLVKAGADVDAYTWEGPPLPNDTRQLATTTDGFTPLMFAVRAGDRATVKSLLALGANAKAPAGDGSTTLVLATLNGHFELAAFLLEQGVNPNAWDPRGSALHVIAWVRRQAWIITLAAADIVPRIPTGDLDSLSLARKLLEAGANPNTRVSLENPRYEPSNLFFAKRPVDLSIERNYLGWDGATAFWLAARHADVDYMRLLAAHGADPNIPSRMNVTPLMVAAGSGFSQGGSPGTDAEALEAVKLCLELGNGVNEVAVYPESDRFDPRFDGETPLHGAAVRGATGIIQFLVDRGANLEAQTKAGFTSFNIADGVFIGGTFKGNPPAAELLRRLMADRNITVVERRPVKDETPTKSVTTPARPQQP